MAHDELREDALAVLQHLRSVLGDLFGLIDRIVRENVPQPPCKGGVHDRMVGTTTECVDHKVVYVETHQWICPPDNHTETSVFRRRTNTPC
ncbi:MAG TPA: hypothetical protein VK669_09990 [Candidatus Limnocylindrales bacterium]|nr:hypothetical protein [Candidatus Limnocylindrales bacterium]